MLLTPRSLLPSFLSTLLPCLLPSPSEGYWVCAHICLRHGISVLYNTSYNNTLLSSSPLQLIRWKTWWAFQSSSSPPAFRGSSSASLQLSPSWWLVSLVLCWYLRRPSSLWVITQNSCPRLGELSVFRSLFKSVRSHWTLLTSCFLRSVLQVSGYWVYCGESVGWSVAGHHCGGHRGLWGQLPGALHLPLHPGNLLHPHLPHLHLWNLCQAREGNTIFIHLTQFICPEIITEKFNVSYYSAASSGQILIFLYLSWLVFRHLRPIRLFWITIIWIHL